MMIKQAVILVGGRGERLRPLTDNIPKPMVLVNGKPFLEHLVLLLKENGIADFLFLTGYLGEKIYDHFKDGKSFGVKIEYSFEKIPLKTGGALKAAKEKVSTNFFLLFGDSYLPINYRSMVNEFIKSGKKVMLAIYDNAEDTSVPFNVKLSEDAKSIAVYNKRKDNSPDFKFCDAGVLALHESVIDFIEHSPSSFEEEVYPKLIKNSTMGYYKAENRFYDIGTIERLKVFERYLLGRK